MSEQDYKAIADRLVELGIVRLDAKDPNLYWTAPSGNHPWPPAHICHDWRVAGACMERMGPGLLAIMLEDYIHPSDCKESFPLAIILAYLEATDET